MRTSDFKTMALGVGCGAAAGAAWGVVFVAPKLAPGFSPLQLAVGRYLAYGVVATILIAPRWRGLRAGLSREDWRALFVLSVLGNILYYWLLASAVQMAGVAITSLVIGFLPVVVTLVGARDRGAAPLRRLAPSLALTLGGVACVGWQAFDTAGAGDRGGTWLGLGCAVGALASWTLYAVANARRLERLDHISSHDWSLLTGLVTGAQAAALAVPAFLSGGQAHAPEAWLRFSAIVAGVAVMASIVGNGLWNRASRLLPLTLVGQLILFETLFALLYGFVWEQRAPTLMEGCAMVLLAAGVLSSASAHVERREAA